ncbi:MAG: BRCT domain-containing protein [Eubacteriales bacterium]|nr:BRCT domain-containing protein [Eubacteriales bacterium]MDD3881862.1 BRCT domain-containing protein [Eubacteriales bacterium]MDD4512893.1 BRCT domain-containing protein [Eubacteriales bacterium]
MNAFAIICIAAILYSVAGLAWHAGKKKRAARARAQEQERRTAAKEAAKAERTQNAKAAPKPAPKRKRGRPRKEKPEAPSIAPVVVLDQPKEPPKTQPQNGGAFRGQTVSFTGTIEGFKRSQAIAAVQAAGGKAYDTMTAGTTLLVVGSNPGMNKLDKADRWIGQVRKITAAQFLDMLKAPASNDRETFTLQAFAAKYCA